MRFYIDIDDTIMITEKTFCGVCGRANYANPVPIESEIKLVNKAYDNGFTIILFSGRGWDCFEKTQDQLKKFNVKYHSLVMGKPDGIYIDKTNANQSLKGIV